MTVGNKSIYIIVTLILLIYFCLYSLLSLTSPKKFTSPDENVNLFYIEHYAATGGSLSYYEPLNTLTFGYTRPRNTTTVGNNVVPSTFIGFYILYGTIAIMLPGFILLMNPLISLLGGLFIYLLSKTLFNKKVALLSLLLLFSLLPYWYWSSMSLYNNLPATVFFIGGVTFLFLAIKTSNVRYYLLCGLFFGVGNLIRLTDITYFIPLLFILIAYRKQIIFKYVLLSFLVYMVIIFPQFIMNKKLYGSYLSFGYINATNIESTTKDSFLISLFNKLIFFLLPSGIRIYNIMYSIQTYIINVITIYFPLALISIFLSLKSKVLIVRRYTIYYLLLCLWIIVYYGSGVFWGLDKFSLDASYIRYFLPIYVLLIPLVANFILSIPRKLSLVVIVIIFITSLLNVHFLSRGLNDIRNSRILSASQAKEIINITEKDSIIITTLSDKILFPERKVITYGPVLNDFITNKKIFDYTSLIKIIERVYKKNENIYILNDRTDLDLVKINNTLSKHNLSLHQVSNNGFLYKVTKK